MKTETSSFDLSIVKAEIADIKFELVSFHYSLHYVLKSNCCDLMMRFYLHFPFHLIDNLFRISQSLNLNWRLFNSNTLRPCTS